MEQISWFIYNGSPIRHNSQLNYMLSVHLHLHLRVEGMITRSTKMNQMISLYHDIKKFNI